MGVKGGAIQKRVERKGEEVLVYGKFEAEMLIPDLGTAGWEPNLARIKFTTDNTPQDKRKGDFMDVSQQDLRPLAREETEAGKAEAEEARKREEKQAQDKEVKDAKD